MPKYPFMTRRKGSKNLYYKRPVPKDLNKLFLMAEEAFWAGEKQSLPH